MNCPNRNAKRIVTIILRANVEPKQDESPLYLYIKKSDMI